MAKAKKVETKSEADMITQALQQAGSVFGGTIGAGLEEDVLRGIFGTPLPHFCLRHFFTSDVLPAAKIILLAGEQHVGKTAMMLEFLRMISQYAKKVHGASMVAGIHSEEKWPDRLPASILGEELIKGLRVEAAENAQEWMTKLAIMLNGDKGGFRGFRNEPLNHFPLGMFVDSMHGAQGAERSKKIKKDGAPGRDFSEIARITTDWFPDFTKWLSETAATMFFILHLKADADGFHSPGGKAKDFFASYTIHMTNPKKKVKSTKEGEIGFWMKLHKDSYGPGGVAMPSKMEWDFDPETGNQRTWFDWEGTTIWMLEQWSGSGDYALAKSHPARELIDGFRKKSAGPYGNKYNLYEITGDEFVSPQEFSAALEGNLEFKAELDRRFHITHRLPTHEYFQRLALETEEALKAKRKGKRLANKKIREETVQLQAPAVTVTPPVEVSPALASE